MLRYLTNLDVLVLFLYFAVTMVIGLYFARREQTGADYFLAGRNIGWIAIGCSLFATNISSEHFIGLAGTGASSGLAVGHIEWMAGFSLLLLGWFMAPLYLKAGVYTMPEFLEKRYNHSCGIYLTTISIIAYIMTKISVTLYAGGLLLNLILGWDMLTSACVMVILAGIYTIAGGLKAVIYTEIIQTVMLIAGASLLTLLGLREVGGFSGLRAALPADYFHMFKPASDPDFPWTGIFFGAPILAVWYWCTDQVIVQRVLAAHNIQQARRGSILAGFLKILPVFILILPGMIALALFPGTKGDEAYPTMVISYLLPSGVRGIVVAGMLAAMMSSLASVFNSSSTMLTMDVYKHYRPDASDHELVLIGRLTTTFMVVIGILWIPLIRSISSHLFIYLQSLQAYISPPIAAVFLLGIFSARVNGKGAVVTLIVGGMLGALRLVLEILSKKNLLALGGLQWYARMNYLHFAVFLFVISGVMLYVVSYLTGGPEIGRLGNTVLAASRPGNSLSKQIGFNNDRAEKRNFIFSMILILTIFSLWWIFF